MERGRAFWVCYALINVILLLVASFRIMTYMWTLVQQGHIFKTRIRGENSIAIGTLELCRMKLPHFLQFHLVQRYTYVAPESPKWLGMLIIFDLVTWGAFCLVLIVSAIAWYILGHATHEARPMRQFALCALHTWSVVLGTSIQSRPAYTPLRIFFLALALYSLNATTIYTSKLINVFTHPHYEHQIDNYNEILESNIPIGNTHHAYADCALCLTNLLCML